MSPLEIRSFGAAMERIAQLDRDVTALQQRVVEVERERDEWKAAHRNITEDWRAAIAREDDVHGALGRVTVALTNLVNRLEFVHNDPRYRAVWRLFATHSVGGYRGPKYKDELDAAKAALTPSALSAGEEWERMQLTEMNYRKELWLNHGHFRQYGDDGEMQCAECLPFGLIDYKRELLDKVERVAEQARMVRIALSPHPTPTTPGPAGGSKEERGE